MSDVKVKGADEMYCSSCGSIMKKEAELHAGRHSRAGSVSWICWRGGSWWSRAITSNWGTGARCNAVTKQGSAGFPPAVENERGCACCLKWNGPSRHGGKAFGLLRKSRQYYMALKATNRGQIWLLTIIILTVYIGESYPYSQNVWFRKKHALNPSK